MSDIKKNDNPKLSRSMNKFGDHHKVDLSKCSDDTAARTLIKKTNDERSASANKSEPAKAQSATTSEPKTTGALVPVPASNSITVNAPVPSHSYTLQAAAPVVIEPRRLPPMWWELMDQAVRSVLWFISGAGAWALVGPKILAKLAH